MVEPISAGAVAVMGGLNMASSLLNQKSANAAGKKAAAIQFMYNNMLMDKQIEWEKERATHAHQWEMQDLKAANLNPALTATGGSGATTGSISAPANAMPNLQGLNMANMSDIIGQVVNLKNQTEATNASNANQYSQAILNIANAKNIPFKNKMELLSNMIAQQNADANTTNAVTNRTVGNAQAKYTNERSRGFTKTRSGSGSIGLKGGSRSYMKSDTY